MQIFIELSGLNSSVVRRKAGSLGCLGIAGLALTSRLVTVVGGSFPSRPTPKKLSFGRFMRQHIGDSSYIRTFSLSHLLDSAIARFSSIPKATEQEKMTLLGFILDELSTVETNMTPKLGSIGFSYGSVT